MVEAAVALPLLALVLFGLTELGLVWRASNNLATATHVASLDLARTLDHRLSDHLALERVLGGLGDEEIATSTVIIYRTGDPDGRPPSACSTIADAITAGWGGVAGVCNVYSGDYLLGMSAADFATPGCVGEPDEAFCPTTRRATFAAGERVAIEIHRRHDWVTKMLPGDGADLSDRGVAVVVPELDL